MQSTEVAKRYAQALAALDGVDVAQLEVELGAVVNLINSDREVGLFISSPRVSADGKKAILKKALGSSVSSTILNFLNLLVDKRREDQLPAIYDEFIAYNDERLNRVRVKVSLSREIMAEGDELYNDIRSTVLAKKGQFGITGEDKDLNLIIDQSVKPELLGGMIIRVGDHLLNTSVRSYINSWKQNVNIRKFSVEKIWQE